MKDPFQSLKWILQLGSYHASIILTPQMGLRWETLKSLYSSILYIFNWHDAQSIPKNNLEFGIIDPDHDVAIKRYQRCLAICVIWQTSWWHHAIMARQTSLQKAFLTPLTCWSPVLVSTSYSVNFLGSHMRTATRWMNAISPETFMARAPPSRLRRKRPCNQNKRQRHHVISMFSHNIPMYRRMESTGWSNSPVELMTWEVFFLYYICTVQIRTLSMPLI